jgi:translation initiation factor 2 subunit 1
MQEWKRAQKAEKLLEIAAKKINKNLDDAYTEVGFKLEEKYGEIYSALEEIASGEDVFSNTRIPNEWHEPVAQVAMENIQIPTVEITGYLDIKCHLPDGVERIKKALISAKEKDYGNEVSLDVRYIKSPRFSIKVTAPDYKSAEGVLKKFAENAISGIKELGGVGKFLREQK